MGDRSIGRVRIKIFFKSGRFYATSEDVEGLWLWHKDAGQLLEMIGPSIKFLYKHNRGIDVEVRETAFSKIFNWIFVRFGHLVRRLKTLDHYKVYPIGAGRLTGAHG